MRISIALVQEELQEHRGWRRRAPPASSVYRCSRGRCRRSADVMSTSSSIASRVPASISGRGSSPNFMVRARCRDGAQGHASPFGNQVVVP